MHSSAELIAFVFNLFLEGPYVTTDAILLGRVEVVVADESLDGFIREGSPAVGGQQFPELYDCSVLACARHVQFVTLAFLRYAPVEGVETRQEIHCALTTLASLCNKER